MLFAKRVDTGKPGCKTRTQSRARIQIDLAPLCNLVANGTRHHITGRKLTARNISHELLATIIDELSALPAHRFANQRQTRRRNGKRGRVELHEFHIGKHSASAACQSGTLAEIAKRRGCCLIKSADPARRQHHGGCCNRSEIFKTGTDHTAILLDQTQGAGVFQNCDRRRCQNLCG